MSGSSTENVVSDPALDEEEIERMMRKIQGDPGLKEKAIEVIRKEDKEEALRRKEALLFEAAAKRMRGNLPGSGPTISTPTKQSAVSSPEQDAAPRRLSSVLSETSQGKQETIST